MENIINYFKKHKLAIILPTTILVYIAIIIFFISIFFINSKFKTNEETTILMQNASHLAGDIAVSSSIFSQVDIADNIEKTEEELKEDELKDKEEEKKAEEDEKKKNEIKESRDSYYIKINRSANTITVYKQDENGNYTIPVKSMVCSTGYASPTGGVYSTRKLGTWHTLFGGVYGQYCTQITGNILFHSVPYLRRGDNASLEYWAYDKLGSTASAGCVRLTTADAQWIYYNCNNGTKVEFYGSATPGPLGKPTATKISSTDSPYRNWDPTDPNPNNPWITNPPNLVTVAEDSKPQESNLQEQEIKPSSEDQQSSSITIVTPIENNNNNNNNNNQEKDNNLNNNSNSDTINNNNLNTNDTTNSIPDTDTTNNSDTNTNNSSDPITNTNTDTDDNKEPITNVNTDTDDNKNTDTDPTNNGNLITNPNTNTEINNNP